VRSILTHPKLSQKTRKFRMGHPPLSYRNLGFERDADVGGVNLRETAAEAAQVLRRLRLG
jgi:hypothetical protein